MPENPDAGAAGQMPSRCERDCPEPELSRTEDGRQCWFI